MILREFKVWGGKREEKDSLYIWAKDADDAIGIARLTDQSICISQWTGNEKSYEDGGIQMCGRGGGREEMN